MGRKATNILAFNDLKKVIKEARDQPQREYRIEGVNRLVLVTQPTGAGSFFVFYTSADGQRRKLKLGQYNPDHYTLHEARVAATDALAIINRGADPVAEAEAKAKSKPSQSQVTDIPAARRMVPY
jgi:Arm DNA-binding domain